MYCMLLELPRSFKCAAVVEKTWFKNVLPGNSRVTTSEADKSRNVFVSGTTNLRDVGKQKQS